MSDSQDPDEWKRDWGLNCRSSARVVYSREDCPESLVGRPDIYHFGQVPTKQPGRDDWSASEDFSIYTRKHVIPRAPPFHPSCCMDSDTISRWRVWRLTIFDGEPVAVIDQWADFSGRQVTSAIEDSHGEVLWKGDTIFATSRESARRLLLTEI